MCGSGNTVDDPNRTAEKTLYAAHYFIFLPHARHDTKRAGFPKLRKAKVMKRFSQSNFPLSLASRSSDNPVVPDVGYSPRSRALP